VDVEEGSGAGLVDETAEVFALPVGGVFLTKTTLGAISSFFNFFINRVT
jgi:hypothetical protein